MPFPSKKKRNHIAQAIFGLRTTTGIRQQQLADELGVSLTTLVRLEKNEDHGKHIPGLPTLDKLERIAARYNLLDLASLFAVERASRTKVLMPELADKLLQYSGRVTQIPIEHFNDLVATIANLDEKWYEAKRFLKSVKWPEGYMDYWVNIQDSIDNHLEQAKAVALPYADAKSVMSRRPAMPQAASKRSKKPRRKA